VPLYVSSRGLTTGLMHAPGCDLEIAFNLVDHALDITTADGRRRSFPLEGQSVASFFRATMAALEELDVSVVLLARPVEVPEAIPFADDETHRTYDAAAANRFWRANVQAHRVLTRFRGRFVGKVSPVHLFWGALDPPSRASPAAGPRSTPVGCRTARTG